MGAVLFFNWGLFLKATNVTGDWENTFRDYISDQYAFLSPTGNWWLVTKQNWPTDRQVFYLTGICVFQKTIPVKYITELSLILTKAESWVSI